MIHERKAYRQMMIINDESEKVLTLIDLFEIIDMNN